VKVLPLIGVLAKMEKQLTDRNYNLAKCIEFLFNSCNQKRLSRKLKLRNIKHNIVCLKSKLDKQRFLAFAVEFANAADKIA